LEVGDDDDDDDVDEVGLLVKVGQRQQHHQSNTSLLKNRPSGVFIFRFLAKMMNVKKPCIGNRTKLTKSNQIFS